MARQTLVDYLNEHVARAPDAAAVLVKRDGAYQSLSWAEVDAQVRQQAACLLALGLQAGDRVCILSQTRLAWVTWDLAIIAAGGVTVPIYQSNLPDDCQYIIDHSQAQLVISEDAGQTAKLRQQRSRLPQLRQVVQIDGEVPADDTWVVAQSTLVAQAAKVDPTVLAQRRKTQQADSPMSIIYTSGTTGRPKGAVITHGNMVGTAEAILAVGILQARDLQLMFLPLAHVFARVLMVAWLANGHRLAFAQNMQTLREDMAEVRPTIMAGVPRVFEKFYAAIAQKAAAQGGLVSRLFAQALALSEQVGRAAQGGPPLGLRQSLLFAVLRRTVLAKVGRALNATLGGQMRVLISGGAPLAPSIAWFFRHVGVPLVEGFGLTETSAATCLNLPEDNRIGSVGRPLPGTEVARADDGELLVRGPGVFVGYWRNDAATQEAMRGAYFATGDIGELDAEGFVRIVDRKKDIIVTAGGKNVAPQNIENLLKTDKLISQAVVHGDRRPFLTALITCDPEALRAFADEHQLGQGSLAQLSQNPRVLAQMQQIVDQFNKQLPRWETLKKFRVLEHDFSIDSGELTPSLKVKRKVVSERYRSILDAFYATGEGSGGTDG